MLSLNFICFSLLIGGRSCILDNTRVALTGFPNFSSFSENLILSEGSWRLSSCYLELSSFVFYLYLIVFRYSCGVTMPTTRSSSVHSEINAAGSPLAVQLAVHTSSTPSTVPMITPSTSVGSSSTTSILSPDVHLLLQTVRDLSNTSKSIQTMADLNSEELLQPLQQFTCTNSSEFLAWARRVQEHLRCIPCFTPDILIKPREEISFSVSTDQIDFMYNFVWNRLFKSISHNAELLSRLNRIPKPDVMESFISTIPTAV